MARLDKVKNMTGLVEWFAKSPKLRGLVNLVVVAGEFRADRSQDREEITEIETMHKLIRDYKLEGEFRWIRAQKNRVRNGELYRYIADTKGAFVQVYSFYALVHGKLGTKTSTYQQFEYGKKPLNGIAIHTHTHTHIYIYIYMQKLI